MPEVVTLEDLARGTDKILRMMEEMRNDHREMQILIAQISAQFDRIDAHFDRINRQFDEMAARMQARRARFLSEGVYPYLEE
jgi:methyl-accepting chemotaxis protein